jgi:hypothetical protein
MTPEQIRTNLARQNAAAVRAAQKLAGALAANGYSQEAIEAALGYSLDDLMDGNVELPDGGGSPAPDAATNTTSTGVQWSVGP